MNRWKKAAILCAIAAAMSNSSPVSAGLNRNSYSAETAAITVANHFPSNMATGVTHETPLTVEFGGAVNQSFYQTVNLNLFNGTETINGELFYNPSARQVMFKSKDALKEGETYTAQLSYFDGLGRTAEKIWTFQTAGNSSPTDISRSASTGSAPSIEPATDNALIITNANMGNGAIAADLPMEVTFSQPIDIATLKTAPIKLLQDNQPVGIDYRLSRDMKTITVHPRNRLSTSANFAITIDRNLSANSGNRLAKKTLIPFRISNGNDEPKVANHIIEETPAPQSHQNSSTAGYDNPFGGQAAVQSSRPAPAKPQMAPAAAPVQVVGLAPQNGTRITNLTQPVTIAFSEEIKAATLNEFTFRLEDDFGPVPAKIHYFTGHKQATLTPVGLLDSNKNYRVVVTQGITDMHGRPIHSGINSMFSTSSPVSQPAMPQMMTMNSAPANTHNETAELENFDHGYQQQQNNRQNRNLQATDRNAAASNYRAPVQKQVDHSARMAVNTSNQPAPADRRVRIQNAPDHQNQGNLKAFKVTSIFPGLNSTNIARRSKIAVHFSEPAEPSTVNNINISVFGNQTRVEGRVIYDRKKNRAIFEPARPLDSKTDYRVIVSDKIKSQMGEPLTQKFSWQFATSDASRKQYLPSVKTAEADAAFFIPLVDSRLKRAPGHHAAAQKSSADAAVQSTFNIVPAKHWSFKSMRHISNRGILNSFPFVFTDNVTRYEFATAIKNALNNLKTMQHMANKPKLKIADMVELEQLIIEFRSELKTYGVNTGWFETFLGQQGVNLQQIQQRVNKLNKAG